MINHISKLPPVENQGTAPKCVGSAVSAIASFYGHSILSEVIYQRAKVIDRIPGEDYDGTEIAAGLRVLEELGIGRIRIIHKKDILSELEHRPVIIDIPTNILVESLDNRLRHAVVIVGYKEGLYTIRNSWGMNWGINGHKNFVSKQLDSVMHESAYTLISEVEIKKKRKKAKLPFIIGAIALAVTVIVAVILL